VPNVDSSDHRDTPEQSQALLEQVESRKLLSVVTNNQDNRGSVFIAGSGSTHQAAFAVECRIDE
jgi:hypothetical protein